MQPPRGPRRVQKSCPLTAPKPSAKNAMDCRVPKVGFPNMHVRLLSRESLHSCVSAGWFCFGGLVLFREKQAEHKEQLKSLLMASIEFCCRHFRTSQMSGMCKSKQVCTP